MKGAANSDAEQELHSYSDKASEHLEALYLSGKFTEANPTLAEVSDFNHKHLGIPLLKCLLK